MQTPTLDSLHDQLHQQHGFSLIEVMVGLVIGLIGMLVVFQVVTAWGRQVQTTTAGGDAQIVGTQAMYALERDIRLAGMGFARSGAMGCPVAVATSVFAAGPTSFPLSPITINYGAAGDPVTIDVLYGNSSFFTAQQPFNNVTSPNAFLKNSSTPFGFRVNDYMIIEAGTGVGCLPLVLAKVSAVSAASVTHAATDADASAADVTAGFTTFTTGQLYSLGPCPQLNRWQVSSPGGAQSAVWYLQERNIFPADFGGGCSAPATNQVGEGVINIQAQYGYDTDNDMMIEGGEWTSAAPAIWNRVLAVRVAILVRSKQFEKPTPDVPRITTTAPAWSGGAFTMTNVDGTADADLLGDPNNWRHYRYRVYEKVIPLRNMLWK